MLPLPDSMGHRRNTRIDRVIGHWRQSRVIRFAVIGSQPSTIDDQPWVLRGVSEAGRPRNGGMPVKRWRNTRTDKVLDKVDDEVL